MIDFSIIWPSGRVFWARWAESLAAARAKLKRCTKVLPKGRLTSSCSSKPVFYARFWWAKKS